jgi:hypothetical protein
MTRGGGAPPRTVRHSPSARPYITDLDGMRYTAFSTEQVLGSQTHRASSLAISSGRLLDSGKSARLCGFWA